MASKETINLEIKLNTAIERKLGKLARLTGKLDLDVKSINLGIQKLNFALQTTSTLLGELSMALGQVAARSQMAFSTRGLSSYNNLLRTAAINSRRLNLKTIPMQLMSSGVYSRAAGPINVQGGGGGLDPTDALLYRGLRSRPGTGSEGIGAIHKAAKDKFRLEKMYKQGHLSRRNWALVRNEYKRSIRRSKNATGDTWDEWQANIGNSFKAFRTYADLHFDTEDRIRYMSHQGRIAKRFGGEAARFRYAGGSNVLSAVTNGYSLTNPYVLGTVGIGAVVAKATHEAGRKEFRTQQLKNLFGKDQGAMIMQGITEFANRTPFQNAFLADQVQQLGAVGFGRQSALQKMRTLGEFSYGDTNRFKSIMSAYTKTVSKGKLDAEARNQFLETGKIDPLQIIARSNQKITDHKNPKRELTGYAERLAEVTRMFHAGEISASLLIKAMDDVAGSMTGLKDSSNTLEGQWSTAVGQFNEAMAQLGSYFLPVATGALKVFNKALGGILGSENKRDFIEAFGGEREFAKFLKMPEGPGKRKFVEKKIAKMSGTQRDWVEDLAMEQRIPKPKKRFIGKEGNISYRFLDYTVSQLGAAMMKYSEKDPDNIAADSTSKDSALEKGITSGGARQKYITIKIDNVKSADTIKIENNDDTMDMVQNNLIMALFKAIAYSGEIATGA